MPKRRIASLAALAAIFLLAGCLGPTPYQVKQFNGGYQERATGPNQWFVEFFGNGYTTRETVFAYWMHRCAELTQQKGFDYYVVVARAPAAGAAVEIDIRHAAGEAPGEAPPTVRVKGATGYTPIFVPSGGGVTTWSARGVIEMHKTLPPGETRRVYDVKEILAKLGPAVRQASESGGNVKVPTEIFAGAPDQESPGRADGVGIKLEELDGLLPKN
jgi:hypothetical protein